MNDLVIVVLLIVLALIIFSRPSEPPGSGITIVMAPTPTAQPNPEQQDGGLIWLLIGLAILAFFLLG